jgi:hypothetical protein
MMRTFFTSARAENEPSITHAKKVAAMARPYTEHPLIDTLHSSEVIGLR